LLRLKANGQVGTPHGQRATTYRFVDAAAAAVIFPLQVKLLDKLMHHMAHEPQQQVVLLSQVLAAEVNIGYEEMLNTQVRNRWQDITRFIGVWWGLQHGLVQQRSTSAMRRCSAHRCGVVLTPYE
jgi:hypothetical protein